MKLWAMQQAGLIPAYAFDLDLHAEVFEACAYHRWGLFEHPVHALGTVILGGGVPKNYNLQPEPALGQVLGLPNVRGYHFDVQIVTAPVTDGSLSSCPPAEAVTWGKVDKDTYLQTTESMQARLLDGDAVPDEGAARQSRALPGDGRSGRGGTVIRARAESPRLSAPDARVTACSSSVRDSTRSLPKTCATTGSGCWRASRTRWRNGQTTNSPVA